MIVAFITIAASTIIKIIGAHWLGIEIYNGLVHYWWFLSCIIYLFWGPSQELSQFWRISRYWLCNLKELPWRYSLFFLLIYWLLKNFAHDGLGWNFWSEKLIFVERGVRLILVTSHSEKTGLALRLARDWREDARDSLWDAVKNSFLLVDWLSLDSVFGVEEAWGHHGTSKEILESALNLVWAEFFLDWLLNWSQNNWVDDWRLFLLALSCKNSLSNLAKWNIRSGSVWVSGHTSHAVSLLGSVWWHSILFGHWKDLGWRDVASFANFSLRKFKGDSFDVKANHSGKPGDSEVLHLVWLVITNIEDVTRRLVAVLLDSICEPSLRVTSELVGVLGLQYLFTDSQWGFHVWVVVNKFFLQFFIFLLGIPVPLVHLLELESGVLSELLELQLCWLALGIFVAFLEGLDLVTGFSVPLEADKSRSVLGTFLGWFLNFLLFLGYLEGILLCGAHDSLWHHAANVADIGVVSHVRLLHLKAKLCVFDQSCTFVKYFLERLDLGLLWGYRLFGAFLLLWGLEKLHLGSGFSVLGTSCLSCGNCAHCFY